MKHEKINYRYGAAMYRRQRLADLLSMRARVADREGGNQWKPNMSKRPMRKILQQER